jgi:Icc-related predicted phosphoesterase
MIEILSRISVPVIVVAGNNETTSELRDACTDLPNWHVLHGNSVVVADTTFWGVGGGIPVTPFGAWSYDFAEDQAVPLLAGCPQRGVLVTHSPPHGALDLSSSGSHLGSLAIRSTIERVRPKLAVCGHIHASGGRQAQLGDNVVINA